MSLVGSIVNGWKNSIPTNKARFSLRPLRFEILGFPEIARKNLKTQRTQRKATKVAEKT